MKKNFILVLTILIFSSLSAMAFDDDFWDAPMQIDSEAKSQQKAVTDTEFNKVVEFFNKKKKKKEDKNKPKGAPIAPQLQDNDETFSEDNVIKAVYEAYPTVMLPVTLITDDSVEIPPGYYRILAVKKENGRFFLNFYQGSALIAKIPAYETGNDHNQKSLNYAKVIPVNDEYVNVIYGDIYCNIESHLIIKK